MKKVEYGKMSREQRKRLFEERLLPTRDVPYRADDIRLTLEELRALVREADEGKWWPTKEVLSEQLHIEKGKRSEWWAEELLQKFLDAITLTRTLILGDPSVLGATDPVQARERLRLNREAFVAAVSLVMGVLAEEPQWDAICTKDAGLRLLRQWLEQAIFRGSETKGALECLRKQFSGYSPYDVCEKKQLEQLYCSHCVWRGWREGLPASQ